MSTPEPVAVETRSLLARVTYFSPITDVAAVPTLAQVAAALTQVDAYIDGAIYLDGRWDRLLDRSERPHFVEYDDPSLISVELHSPLVIVVSISAVLIARHGDSLVRLAERISTALPRIQRTRAEDLMVRDAANAVREGRADASALAILNAGPQAPFPRGPDQIDFIDPESDPDDTELQVIRE